MPTDRNQPAKLSLFETCGIGMAGMVGGGIFAVLGEAVITAGYATFISLGLAGLLALITGIIYSRLTVTFDEGGCFNFIDHILGKQAAGTISWALLAGYMCTVGLYAFAFGAYADRMLEGSIGPNPWLASIIIVSMACLVLLKAYNPAKGFGDYFISLKILIIGGLIVIGFFTVKPTHISIFSDSKHQHIWLGAALIFVIYEGFQILTYRYDLIQNHRKNLPKSIWISISIVTVLYMIIAFILTDSLGAGVIAKNKETAIALLAQPLFGRIGIKCVLLGGLISTSAAIFTTMEATGHLAKRIAADHQLPRGLTRLQWKDTPVFFILLFATGAIALQFMAGLDELTILCSALFLMIFSVVNFMGSLHHIFTGWKQCLPLISSAGCAVGFFLLVYYSYAYTSRSLYLLAGIVAGLICLQLLYASFHSGYKGAE